MDLDFIIYGNQMDKNLRDYHHNKLYFNDVKKKVSFQILLVSYNNVLTKLPPEVKYVDKIKSNFP